MTSGISLCDDVMVQLVNRSLTETEGADLVDVAWKFLSSDSWTFTRVGVAVCLAVASLVVNRVLLLETLHRQLDNTDRG